MSTRYYYYLFEHEPVFALLFFQKQRQTLKIASFLGYEDFKEEKVSRKHIAGNVTQ